MNMRDRPIVGNEFCGDVCKFAKASLQLDPAFALDAVDSGRL